MLPDECLKADMRIQNEPNRSKDSEKRIYVKYFDLYSGKPWELRVDQHVLT